MGKIAGQIPNNESVSSLNLLLVKKMYDHFSVSKTAVTARKLLGLKIKLIYFYQAIAIVACICRTCEIYRYPGGVCNFNRCLFEDFGDARTRPKMAADTVDKPS